MPFQYLLSRGIHQGDTTIQASCDQAVAGRANDVLVQSLEAFQRAAGELQSRIDLAQLGCQQSRQIGNRSITKKIYKNDSLQSADTGMRKRIRGNDLEKAEFHNSGVQNERQARSQIGAAA